MKKQVLASVVVAVFALGLAGSLAFAAGAVAVDIPFSFIVKDKEMPAGKYEIRQQGEANLAIKGDKGGQVLVPVIERLADTGGKEPKVVFDKMTDGKSYLSEVHIPGADGFLLSTEGKGKETHVTVSGKE